MPRWIRWKFENPWKILGWCLESAQRSFFSISSGRNWYFLSKVMKSAILSHFPYILYRKKPKTTLFDFRTCSPSQKVMKFAWDLSYIIRMKPWKYWDGLISPTIKWHDSQTCGSDRTHPLPNELHQYVSIRFLSFELRQNISIKFLSNELHQNISIKFLSFELHQNISIKFLSYELHS